MTSRISAVFLVLNFATTGINSTSADDAVFTLEVKFNDASMLTGGTWQVFAEIVDGTPDTVDGSNGFAAIRLLIDDIDFGTGGDAINLVSNIGAINPLDPGGPNERFPALVTGGGTIDLIYAQDLSETFQQVVGGIGVGGEDLIASGTFSPGDTPAFGDDDQGFTTNALALNIPATPGFDSFGGALDFDNVITSVVLFSIPEPTSLSLVILTCLGILGRRNI